jgi:AcrR family transcriptional regulator
MATSTATGRSERQWCGRGPRTAAVEIASRLFATHGYDGTSLRDIAEEAQITKAALYYHFPNKEALHQHIVIRNMALNVASAPR